MKILITGHNGYVGNILYNNLKDKYIVYGASKNSNAKGNIYQCDFTNIESVKQVHGLIEPDIILHAAGNKNLRRCEENSDTALQTNGKSIENIVRVRGDSVKIVYISSDYVFDGLNGNYKENDHRNPQTVYGKTKVYGEDYGLGNSDNFFVIRLSALYDLNATFPKFIRNNLENGTSIDCFTNVFYSPTYYKNFLSIIEGIIKKGDKTIENKVFHCEGEKISRYDFAYKYAKIFGYNSDLINPVEEELNKFLPGDLSLNNEITLNTLGIQNISIEDALYELKHNENI